MSFFDSITQLPEDPILNLPILFAADPRPQKVNLGIGSYKDAEGKSFVLASVKKAEAELLKSQRNKDYLPIEGDSDFLTSEQEMLLGAELVSSLIGGLFTLQTLGGTGALRLGSDFLCQEISKTIFVSAPTWPNHKPIFVQSGMKIHQYRYYDENSHRVDFAGLCNDVLEMPPGSTILLQAGCHNPTGIDLSLEQWQELSPLIKKQKIIPFIDFAYQGFKDSIESDAAPVRYLVEQGHEILIAHSLSKNFGLYGERLGSLTVVTQHKDAVRKIASQMKKLIRCGYSTPPKHGAEIVSTIVKSKTLKAEWIEELANMRERIREMRHTLAAGLQSKGSDKDWSFLNRQSGFFSFCGFNEGQVHRLIKDHGIYLPSNGRINIGGLNGHNIDYVIDAILTVIHS